ncbi:RNA-binding protein [Halobacteriales archaeon QS_3_64_16]|nr:MAG: RNA-binding protein [Halobacteriales archaeon QS_3_64_16]
MTAHVRVRGIYATALVQSLAGEEFRVVQPSRPIAERFSIDDRMEGYDVAIETTDDRLGVGASGAPDAVGAVRERLSSLAIDTLAWSDPTPWEAVFSGVVTDVRSGGAVVDLGAREGLLPARAVGGDIEKGDHEQVQVREPTPPRGDDRPLLDTDLRLDGGGLLELVRAGDLDGSSSGAKRGKARSFGNTTDLTDLLPTDVPENWRVRRTEESEAASFDALDGALADVVARAEDLDEAIDTVDAAGSSDVGDASGTVWAGRGTLWVRFGRASRFALDDRRRAVTPTMPGHHRIKASTEAASAAVDFAESVCGSGAGQGEREADEAEDSGIDFPFSVATRQFGPREGEAVAIAHGKPDGREFVLGRGEVLEIEPGGTVLLRREMSSGGTYDALGTERQAGDVAISRFKEGRWWYQTRYRGGDGESRGAYVNVCTPVEIFPEAIRYTDLHVDVVKRPDGEVERVDDDELDAAVADGELTEALAEKARATAGAIERSL